MKIFIFMQLLIILLLSVYAKSILKYAR